jgi:hypothetical protein
LRARVNEADRGEDLVDAIPRGVHDRREVAQILVDAEVAVDRRRLRHIADARAKRGGAGRVAEDGDAAGGVLLDAGDGPHQRRLCRSRSGRAGR